MGLHHDDGDGYAGREEIGGEIDTETPEAPPDPGVLDEIDHELLAVEPCHIGDETAYDGPAENDDEDEARR